MSKKLLILVATVLILSMVTTVNAEVVAKSKILGIDKNISRQIAVVQITLDKPGQQLVYVERYYTRNSDGKLKLEIGRMYYNGTVGNQTLTLRIKRPLMEGGKPYPIVRAMGTIDGKQELNAFFKYPKSNGTNNGKTPGEDTQKKFPIPGFESILSIVSVISLVCILKRRQKGGK